MMERRVNSATDLQVRADEQQPQLAGYAAVFNAESEDLGGFREIIAEGAFSSSLDRDVRALWNHNTDFVIGRTAAGTLRLREDEHGLYTEIDPPESASAYLESVRRGDVTQMSFGFRVNDDRIEEDERGNLVRTLLDVELLEVSPVAFPAYPQTSIDARSLDAMRRRARPLATAAQVTRARMRMKMLERLYG